MHGKSQTITYALPSSAAQSQSTSVVRSSTLPPADADADGAQPASWPSVLAEMKQDFMAEFDIPTATVRADGLAVSPLGGITAVVASFHPKDTLEYIIAGSEKTAVIFAAAPGGGGPGAGWKRLTFHAATRCPTRSPS